MSSTTKAYCHHPWTELNLEYHGAVGCCCLYKFERDFWDKSTPFNTALFRNGDVVSDLRKSFKTGNIKNTGCYGCPRLSRKQIFPAADDDLDRDQLKNHTAAEKEFFDQQIRIISSPLSYYLVTGVDCNLRCRMCSQADVRATQPGQLNYQKLRQLIEAMQVATDVTLAGGEIFVMPDTMKFITHFTKGEALANVRLHLVTNGTLLHNHLDLLKKIEKLTVAVSVDATGTTYEHIRRGGSWSKLRDNLLFIKDLSVTQKKKWRLSISAIMMNEILPSIDNLADFAVKNAIPLALQPLCPTSSFNDRAIASSEIKQLSDKLQTAYSLFEKRGWHSAAETVKNKIKELAEVTDLADSSASNGNDDVQTATELGKAAASSFMIWGTSSYYRTCLRDWLLNHAQKSNCKGFIDSDPRKWQKNLDGFQIFAPEHLENYKPQNIIIASALRKEISDQIETFGINYL